MKKIFISFADSRFSGSKKRIKKQAKKMRVYDEIIIADERDLDEGFRKKFEDHLVPGSRGYGYWAWKPQIVLQILEQCNLGDIVHYADIGCHLNQGGRARLLEYFEATKHSPSGLLAFAYEKPGKPLIYDGRKLFNWPNENWVKGDVIDYFGVRDRDEILNSQMIGATTFFAKKKKESIDFLKEWKGVIETGFHLIDDTPSVAPNKPDFIEHRHDQALFSILCRLNHVSCLSAYEHYYPSVQDHSPDWEALRYFPIHARRDKEIGLTKRIKSRVARLIQLTNK